MLNAAQCRSMKALNAHAFVTDSSVHRSKSLQSPPGSFLLDSVYYTTTDTPHITSHFTPVACFVLFCGGQVEVNGRRADSSDVHLMHSALNEPSWLCTIMHLHSMLGYWPALSIECEPPVVY